MRAPILALCLTACGGVVLGGADGGEGGVDVAGLADAGFTACSGPRGMKLCGGQCGQSCPVDNCTSTVGNPNPKGELGTCFVPNGFNVYFGSLPCEQCSDGNLCATPSAVLLSPDPIHAFFDMGCADPGWATMYHLNGRDDLARYSDRGAYTGAPLPPLPASCPSSPGLRLCGGACGACAAGDVCVGRSPLHPYSLCVHDWKQQGGTCSRNQLSCDGTSFDLRCLTFKVDEPSQPVADFHSICADRGTCEAAALYYPGGAFCTGGPTGK